MSEHLIQKNYDFIKRLPSWAKTFAIKYCSNTASTYIFHGNIRDFLAQRTEEDEFRFVEIQDYIGDALFGYNGKILCYDRSSGISFVENPYNQLDPDASKNDYIHTMNDHVKKLIEKGESPEDAFRLADRKRRRKKW